MGEQMIAIALAFIICVTVYATVRTICHHVNERDKHVLEHRAGMAAMEAKKEGWLLEGRGK